MKTLRPWLIAVLGSLMAQVPCLAGQAFHVKIDTTVLVGHEASPFFLNFQLTDGSGEGSANKAVIISNFTLGTGGALVDSPILSGGTSGNLSTRVTIRDQQFLNEFTQSFQPGSTLGFDIWMSTGTDPGGALDCFSIALLDNSGAEIPSMGLILMASDPVLTTDMDDFLATLQVFGGDTNRSPVAGGTPIGLTPPQIQILSSARKGDVNGDGTVDVNDAIVALRIVGGLKTFGSVANADTWPPPYGDGRVEIRDILHLLRSLNTEK